MKDHQEGKKMKMIRIITLLFHHHLDQQEQLLNQASVLMLYPAIETMVVDKVTRLKMLEVLYAYYSNADTWRKS